ncbi:hypothetical protein P5705_12905 [Pseudomonas entomophila]|uniref:hypothetical protein n=1 Tax=Pseudomonas entomophila TaxID=312306 RepID=UPI0024060E77|nr:hypothetical protein [Pseudomonas entomophila]MDF9618547.1 hypothetical protein [Pseudomonas entomophila]
MSGQRGVVLLTALTLSLLLGLLSAMALQEALLQQRLAGEQRGTARAFEQAEASLVEGALLLLDVPPALCQACLPPGLPAGEPGRPWLRTASGFVLLQALGESTRAAGRPQAEGVTLFRVTAFSRQSRGRQFLEAVYAVDGRLLSGRVSWRQRLAEH